MREGGRGGGRVGREARRHVRRRGRLQFTGVDSLCFILRKRKRWRSCIHFSTLGEGEETEEGAVGLLDGCKGDREGRAEELNIQFDNTQEKRVLGKGEIRRDGVHLGKQEE